MFCRTLCGLRGLPRWGRERRHDDTRGDWRCGRRSWAAGEDARKLEGFGARPDIDAQTFNAGAVGAPVCGKSEEAGLLFARRTRADELSDRRFDGGGSADERWRREGACEE